MVVNIDILKSHKLHIQHKFSWLFKGRIYDYGKKAVYLCNWRTSFQYPEQKFCHGYCERGEPVNYLVNVTFMS